MCFSSDFLTLIITILIGRLILLSFRKCCNLFREFKSYTTSGSWRIYEINDEWECTQACKFLKKDCQDLSVLGFDCEWNNFDGNQRPVALLQLASPGGMCCLFRLNKLKNIPTELKHILSDLNIIKMGVCPLNDAMLLLKDYNTKVCSTLDLRYLYPKATGLASLANSVLGVQLNKSWKLSCSNWETPKLKDEQIEYASKDAYVAVEIFKVWLASRTGNFTESVLNKELEQEIHRYLDIPYQTKFTNQSTNKQKIVPESYRSPNKRDEKKVLAARKSPLYDNCFMNAPDGRLLCSCDRRKAQWYVDRGLAKVLSGEPYTIKLLFEPAARGDESSNGEFYRQLKQNCCVVCGASESYLKHYVVPREYRKHFPAIMKDHQSHDIVLMCIQCHYLAGQHNENLKQKLAVFCNAPIQRGKVTENKTIKKVKNCAKALIAADKALPQKRKLELQNEIKQFYEIHEFNASLLDKAIHLESKIANDNNDSHGIKVVNYFKTSGEGLKNLELLWRKHFLATMKPKYLPTFWSTTHNHSRLTE